MVLLTTTRHSPTENQQIGTPSHPFISTGEQLLCLLVTLGLLVIARKRVLAEISGMVAAQNQSAASSPGPASTNTSTKPTQAAGGIERLSSTT